MNHPEVKYEQTILHIKAKHRGFELITNEVEQALSAMPSIHTGMAHLFLQHTSASLCISENTCADVRADLESFFNKLAPDDARLYQHILEGEDDMPAHIKNVILGCNLSIPIHQGRLALGRWQGIYLCEHRNDGTERHIILTAHGI